MSRGLIVLFTAALAIASPAAAQQSRRAAPSRPASPRYEVSGGVRWIGPLDFGTTEAKQTTAGGGTRPLFASSTTLDGSVGGTAMLGIRLSRLLQAEVAAVYNPARLTSRISSDVEGIPDVSLDAPVTQFLLEGGLIAQPPRWGRRTVSPFLTAGVGYLRQLNDGRTLIDTGRSYYVGGGMHFVRTPRRPRRLKGSGLRVDARALMLRGGVAPDETTRITPTVTATFFARF